jgi:crotonobetainyl-CoA:carnitine CoA-transferase CaiB-like acyl-CoA transferase
VPCASIWTIDEIVQHPQLAHREVLQTVDSAHGPLTLIGSGFRLAEGGNCSIDRAPPLLGEHTDEILLETGYAAGEIETLRREGVV